MQERFAFGPFVLSPEAGTLLRQGLPVPVGYRALLLLTELVKHPGEVLTKAGLMDIAWPRTVVEEGNLSVQVASLRKLLGPASDGMEWIATVARVGYRFAGAVEKLDDTTPVRSPSEPGPSIAVMPFANLSGDVEQQYFADGLAEDIITRVSRLRWLYVSARNSSFSYRGKSVDAAQVGRELGVRYVLDGSVRRSGERLRIGADLSDTSTGRQVWGERYDVKLADFFELQDQIADSVIGAIEPRLYAAEHQRFQAHSPGNLDAWGFVMKAMPHVWTWGSAAEIDAAEGLLKQATNLDPDYPRANCLLALMLATRVMLGLDERATHLAAAREMADRAIQRDAEDPWTHLAAGFACMVARRSSEAVEALSEAIALNPSLAIAHMLLGCTYGYEGMPDDGLHHLALAERLSPRDFTQAANLSIKGMCQFVARNFSESARLENRAVKLRPHFGTAWRTLAAAAGMAGDHAAAAQALAEARRLQPSLSVDWVENYFPMVKAGDRALYIEGLRIAGLR